MLQIMTVCSIVSFWSKRIFSRLIDFLDAGGWEAELIRLYRKSAVLGSRSCGRVQK